MRRNFRNLMLALLCTAVCAAAQAQTAPPAPAKKAAPAAKAPAAKPGSFESALLQPATLHAEGARRIRSEI